MHAVDDEILAGEISGQHGAGVGAVEDADLAVAVGFYAFGKDRIEAGLVERQLAGDECRGFNDPEMEELGGIEKLVTIAAGVLQGLGFIGGVAGVDAVNQGVGKNVGLLDPGEERRSEIPVAGGLENRLFEIVSVVFDELAGQQDEAPGGSPAKALKRSSSRSVSLAGNDEGGASVTLSCAE